MAYTSTTWTDNTTLLNQTNLNHLETQYLEAISSFEQDLFTAFVLNGFAGSKDGTNANQLDVSSGTAFLKQADGTLRRRTNGSPPSQTTSVASTTYYLYLQPDGTWYWSTTNSPAANSLAICQVTTDGSGNILAVTDERQLNTSLLSGMSGSVSFSGGGVLVGTSLTGTAGTLPIASQQSGAANGISFESWNGTGGVFPFSVGGQFNGALAWVGNSGFLNTPGVIGSNGSLNVSSLQSGAANGIFFKSWDGSAAHTPFSVGGQFNGALSWIDNSGNLLGGGYIQSTGTVLNADDPTNKVGVIAPAQRGGVARSLDFQSYDGTSLHNVLSIGTNGFAAQSKFDDGGVLHPVNGGSLSGTHCFSGTGTGGGTGTFTHGLSTTPGYVGWMTTEGSGSTETVGIQALGSSTVGINMPTGNSWPFVAVAIAN